MNDEEKKIFKQAENLIRELKARVEVFVERIESQAKELTRLNAVILKRNQTITRLSKELRIARSVGGQEPDSLTLKMQSLGRMIDETTRNFADQFNMPIDTGGEIGTGMYGINEFEPVEHEFKSNVSDTPTMTEEQKTGNIPLSEQVKIKTETMASSMGVKVSGVPRTSRRIVETCEQSGKPKDRPYYRCNFCNDTGCHGAHGKWSDYCTNMQDDVLKTALDEHDTENPVKPESTVIVQVDDHTLVKREPLPDKKIFEGIVVENDNAVGI
jgi:hypothetical protein